MKATVAHAPLSAAEIQLIDICVRIAQFLGLPKSLGELYGLLFVSPQPLSLDALTERLSMSKGSASQGLKLLRSYGAVKSSYVPGDRRDYYVSESDLNKLLSGFLRERVLPGVGDLAERLKRIEEEIARLPAKERGEARERLDRLQGWQRQIETALPLFTSFLGK